MSATIAFGFFTTASILLIGILGFIGELYKAIYITNKAEKVAKDITDKVTRETELRIKRDFKRGIFD